MNVSLSFEGHSVAYQCKGLDQRTIVCEYEEHLSSNEKVKLCISGCYVLYSVFHINRGVMRK